MAGTDQGVVFAKALSRMVGWIYTLCWSASFYPQPILNWQRKSTHGLAIDFPTINLLGFVCYTISTSSLLYSPLIRRQYAERRAASEPTVRLNDVAFAVHGVLMSSLYYSQFWPSIWGFQVGRRQRLSHPIAGVFWGGVVAVVLIILLVFLRGRDGGRYAGEWAWIDVVYTFGYVKLCVTVVKYMPQVWMNYQRQSTEGWSIGQILLDFSGGVLSLLQLLIDASFQADWSGVTGNPVKLGLGNVSVFFDLIFIIQHYLLYARRPEAKVDEAVEGVEEALVADR